MANKRIPMRKIRDVLRLHFDRGLPNKMVGKCLAISPATVHEYLTRFRQANLSWPLPADLDDTTLERALFPDARTRTTGSRTEPDWATIHRELRRKGVTLALLWNEYLSAHPDGYQYSHFCERYRQYAAKLDLTMRQTHRAGERLFVDYCGPTVDVLDAQTGQPRAAQIFVAVLGASGYTYAEATWSQQIPDWIGAHVRCFQFLGGIPSLIVPDNLKSAVTRPHRDMPRLNATYRDMAVHYGTAVLPARVRKPRDKAKAEQGVQLVERWILAALRHQTFLSLRELNAAIRRLLDTLNRRPFRKMPGSRLELFLGLDRPALAPLPAHPYECAEWIKARAGSDYHVSIEGHAYSVPHVLAHREVEVRLTARMVEVLHGGRRVACHPRTLAPGKATTLREHMPAHHQFHHDWTPDTALLWAESLGSATRKLFEKIISSAPHPEIGLRKCRALRKLAALYPVERFEAASNRALELHRPTYRVVQNLLVHGREQGQTLNTAADQDQRRQHVTHENVRGPEYFEVATHA